MYLTFKWDGYSGSVNTCREVKRNNDQTDITPSALIIIPLRDHLLTVLSCRNTGERCRSDSTVLFYQQWADLDRCPEIVSEQLHRLGNNRKHSRRRCRSQNRGVQWRVFKILHQYMSSTQASTQPLTVQPEGVFQCTESSAMNPLWTGKAWIGLHDDLLNSWSWSLENSSFYGDGEAGFRNWNISEPDNFNGQQYCVALFSGSPYFGTWGDVDCTVRYPFMCYSGEFCYSLKVDR